MYAASKGGGSWLLLMYVYSLVPRPFPLPGFNCLQYVKEGLGDLVMCYIIMGRQTWGNA